jgi:3'5'-cyclic nucleotide phosphodiesterase
LHGINYLCRLGKIKGIFTDLEQLSLYIAAAIHDYDHPGVNNNFLIATRDPIALIYNDKSVLENHHCSNAFKVLLEPHNFFVESLDKKSFNTFRAEVVDMVLATDLAQHFDLLTMFKKKVRHPAPSLTSKRRWSLQAHSTRSAAKTTAQS